MSAAFLCLGRPLAEASRVDHTVLYGDYNRFGNLHTGLDLPSPLGRPVLAAGPGRVMVAGSDTRDAYGPRTSYYGNLVILRVELAVEGPPLHMLYGHLSRVTVSAGQDVRAGKPIGAVGMTGAAVGPHLHLEVRVGGLAYSATRNPGLWLRPPAGAGAIAGRLADAAGRPIPADRLLVYQVSGATRLWRVVRSYPAGTVINADEALQENFVLPEVPAGEYLLVAGRGRGVARVRVSVAAGQLAWAELRLSL